MQPRHLCPLLVGALVLAACSGGAAPGHSDDPTQKPWTSPRLTLPTRGLQAQQLVLIVAEGAAAATRNFDAIHRRKRGRRNCKAFRLWLAAAIGATKLAFG